MQIVGADILARDNEDAEKLAAGIELVHNKPLSSLSI